jgi:hypothetical protein
MTIIVDTDGSGVAFATVEDAAIVALQQCDQLGGDRREFGGVIYSATDGTIHYTVPVAGEKYGLDFFVRKDATVRLLAIFHNHPHGAYSQFFSHIDVAISRQLNLESFMYSAETKKIYEFDPDRPAVGLIDDDGILRTSGRIISVKH